VYLGGDTMGLTELSWPRCPPYIRGGEAWVSGPLSRPRYHGKEEREERENHGPLDPHLASL